MVRAFVVKCGIFAFESGHAERLVRAGNRFNAPFGKLIYVKRLIPNPIRLLSIDTWFRFFSFFVFQ